MLQLTKKDFKIVNNFDKSTGEERKKLIIKIKFKPTLSKYTLDNNIKITKEEKNILINSILSDSSTLFNYFISNQNNIDNKLRNRILNNIYKSPDLCHICLTAFKTDLSLTEKEKDKMYDTVFISKSITDLLINTNFNESLKNKIIDRVFNGNLLLAEVLNDNINKFRLSESQIDKLNSLLIFKKLR